MSGLPVFDRERNFRGYRGFGICRDARRTIAALLEPAREPPQPAGPPPQRRAASRPRAAARHRRSRPALAVVPASPNVVPFRAAFPRSKPAAER